MTNPMSATPAKRGKKCRDFGHRNKQGQPCGANVIKGTTGCVNHVGIKTELAKAKGAVVVELQSWGLDGQVDLRDPGEVLLRLVTQSANRVELYSKLLAEAYEAAERLREAHEAQRLVNSDDMDDALDGQGSPAVQTAAKDLERIFNTGGVSALIGHSYSSAESGGVYATGEAIRGLAQLEAQERDRAANFAAKGVAAGLAERQVRLAEQMTVQVAGLIGAVLRRLGVEQSDAVVLRMVIDEVSSMAGGAPRVIEGRAR